MKLIDFFYNGEKNLISLAGGGGKTSFMYRYAKEWRKYLKGKLLITTTTKMSFTGEENIFDRVIINPNGLKTDEYKNEDIFFIASKILKEEKTEKLIGFDNFYIDDIFVKGYYQSIVSESDGSKKRPIKAYKENEPCHPINSTDIAVIIGLSSYRKCINDTNVHRVNIFKEVTNTKDNDIIDENTILKLIESENGLFKNSPKKSKKHVIFNQADLLKESDIKYLYNYFVNNLKNIDSILFASFLEEEPIVLYKKLN